ncbi:MAG: CHAT domain-containing protein, partial [Chitinophagaceae bacterium]|nr:CHAT domain-containing protein [Chitinophagaceae bacterium]
MKWVCLSLFILLFPAITTNAQKSETAKKIYQQAITDTTSKKYASAANNFYQAAKEELKSPSPDYDFAAKRMTEAAEIHLYNDVNFNTAHDYLIEGLGNARKAKDQNLVFTILKEIGSLYDLSSNSDVQFPFPKGNVQETVEAIFSITKEPSKKSAKEYEITFNGGSNDGVYEGAEGYVYGKFKKEFTSRENTKLGKVIISRVYPNYSVATVYLFKTADPFYDVYIDDMAGVPIRFPKKGDKDVFLDVSLLGIHFVDNSRMWLAHPRTLMYYNSPELDKDLYASMKSQVQEIWDMLHDDSTELYHKPVTEGRFKGKSMMDALRDTKEQDLKSFLDFVKSYPGKYMGGTWKISEVYATWIINNSPLGSGEALDSLLGYYNNDKLFNAYRIANQKVIFENFNTWETDAEDFSTANDFVQAKKVNDVLLKISTSMNNDSLLAWSYFNKGYITSRENDSLAIIYYKKAKLLFEKIGEKDGASYCINNIGYGLQQTYRYKEAQTNYEEALQIRMGLYATDTSNGMKQEVARAHTGIGLALFKQSKYKEAINEYLKSESFLKNLPSISAKKNLATIYSYIGESYQQMGQYKEAADFYNNEFMVRKALGDEPAMADAFDNKAYLLSLLGNNRESYNVYLAAYQLKLKNGNKKGAGFSMSNMAQMLWTLGKYDSAIVAHHAAIQLRVDAGDTKGEAYSWKKLGGLYKDSGEPQKSLDAFNKALALYKQQDDKEEYAALLEDFASNYNKVKDYGNAEKNYKEALDIYHQIKSKSKIADVDYSLATVYYADKQFEQSEKSLNEAIDFQKESNDQAGLMYSYLYKGFIKENYNGDYNAALGFMKQSLQLAVLTTSESNIAYSQSSIGRLYEDVGMYDSAANYYDLALAGYKKLDDKKNQADVLVYKGYFYSSLAQYSKSRKFFDDALVIADASDNKSAKADALGGISQLELLTGNFVKAEEINNNVMKLWKQEDNPWGMAGTYILEGNIKNKQSEFGEAVKNYQKADSMYKVLGMEKSRATSINNIGTIYFYQGDYEKALPQFFNALNILQQTNDDKRFISLVKGNIGEVYTGQKKYGDAEKWLKESLELARSIKSKKQIYETAMILARLKTATKDYAAAKGFFEEANALIIESDEKPAMVQLETDWGKWFYINKDFDNAEKHLQNCITISNSIGLRTYVWKAYATMADLKNEQNKTTDAVKQLEQAIKVVEELKARITGGEEAKKIFANDESVVDLYQKMATYLKKLGRNDEALAYIEKSNIENIKLQLKNDGGNFANAAEGLAAASAKEKKTEINQYEKQRSEELSKPAAQQNKEKIARLEKMTTVAEADYEKFIIDLAKKYPDRTDLQQIDVRAFTSEREFIPADVALLSYLVTNDELSIFIVMKDTLLIKDIPINKKLLEEKIKQFYNASTRPLAKSVALKRGAGADNEDKSSLPVDISALSAELYNLLINPAKEAIAGKKRVAIVPSGLLCFVPFHSLSFKDQQGQVQYFGEEKQVFYVNKITTVTNGRNHVMNDLKIVAVGNADHSLQNAETEVKSLQQDFPTAVVYVGDAATKKNVLGTQGEYNILHLATHGILDYSNAENSYLVFASDKQNGDDGKLMIHDIYKIGNLRRFKMVTLSACETAVVKNIVDGWPISTASAFIEVGVPTVIASLWKVDDKATSLLMEKFYENMKTMDKVAALQNAQMYLRQQ